MGVSARFCGPAVIRDGVEPSFAEALRSCLGHIPQGRVATCGCVARALGDVRAARAVAQYLVDHPEVLAGHRVVRADGRPVLSRLTPLLAAEGTMIARGRVAPGRLFDELPEVPLLGKLRREQERLERRVVERDAMEPVERFGAVDVSYDGERAFAVAVTVDAKSLEPLEIVVRQTRIEFPYIPTYLAFRELPAIRPAVEGLRTRPEVLFVDGHGRLHPLGFGFACYAGVAFDLPTVGVAKHPLVGRPSPSRAAGDGAVPFLLGGQVRGYAWRPPGRSRPLYVSVGHRVSLRTALSLTKRATRDRYPEPLRIADRLSKEERRKNTERSASERAAHPRPPAQSPQGT